MKAAVLALTLCLGSIVAHSGPVPQRILTLDVTKTDTPWSITATRGESFYIRADLYYRGTPYTNVVGGWLWYANSAADSSGVRISSSVSEPGSVWFLMDSTNSLGLSTNPAAYFAQIILTNSTILAEWSRGTFTNRNGGGITGTGTAPTSATFNVAAYSYVGVFPSSVIPSTEATLPTGSIVATNQGAAGQSFFFSAGSPTGVSTGYFATASGAGDMLASVYDAAGGARQVAFGNDLIAETNRAQVAEAALYPRSNPSNWITLAQVPAQTQQMYVAQAGTAQVAVVAQGMPWSGLTGTAPKLAEATNADTVTTITAAQVASAGGITNNSIATLAGVKAASSAGGSLISSGNATCMTWGAGSGCNVTFNDGTTVNGALTANGGGNVLTNGGATINGSPITNGAAFTITGGGGGGGISNIAVAGVTGTLSGSGSNVLASVSLASLAGAGVATNYAATPFDAAVTLTNTSALTVTSYFGHAYSRTFTSTGTITHLFLGTNATAGNEIFMETTATGLPARVWPAGYVFGYGGSISSNAPSPSPWSQMSVQKTPMGSIVWCVTGQVWQAGTP